MLKKSILKYIIIKAPKNLGKTGPFSGGKRSQSAIKIYHQYKKKRYPATELVALLSVNFLSMKLYGKVVQKRVL